MPLDFPNGPAPGDVYAYWRWDGEKWVSAPPISFGGGGSSAPPPSPLRVVTPPSGAVVAMAAGETGLYVASGALASLTLRLPPDPVSGQEVEISFAAPVTALVLTDAAAAPLPQPTSAYGPGAALEFRFVPPSWVYWK